jgi:4-hydroxybenzoate polyprenyltransferase
MATLSTSIAENEEGAASPPARRPANPSQNLPLYVDLDAALTPANISAESFVSYARTGIIAAIRLTIWILYRLAHAKLMVAQSQAVEPALLPYRLEILLLIEKARAAGQRVMLVGSADRLYLETIAAHLGLFDGILASSDAGNKRQASKLGLIQADAGGAFDYIGGSRADRFIMRAARHSVSVRHVPRNSQVEPLDCRSRPQSVALLHAMRPHQWTKNLLTLIPLGTSGLWRLPHALLHAGIATALFSLAASGVYLINDLLDIGADRSHPTKCRRPLASAELSIGVAILSALALLCVSTLLAFVVVGTHFAIVLIAYIILTKAYSFRLKSVMALDVLTLASLYSIRILAGSEAISVPISSWLLIFSIFIFLSLAYLKRYTELSKSQAGGERIRGRGYYPEDLNVVMMTGIASGMVSVLVLALFISSPTTPYQSGTPNLLWALCLILIYWLNRIWLMARRGQVSGDPIAFAMTDRISLYLGTIAIITVIAAQSYSFGF